MTPTPLSRVQMAPPNSTFDRLLAPGGYGAVIAIAPPRGCCRDKSFEQYARRGGFTLNAIERGESAGQKKSRHYRGNAGEPACCPPRPRFPMTISTRSGCSGFWSRSPGCRPRSREISRARSTRTRPNLRWRTASPPGSNRPDTDKDAFIVAHQGAADYINDDTKSFIDRYSDLAVSRRRRAQHHRFAVRRALHQGDPDRAGESQRTGDRHSRYRRADGTCHLDGGARRAAGRTRSHPAGRGDRPARRHHLERTGWIRSSSAMNSCATNSACGARA